MGADRLPTVTKRSKRDILGIVVDPPQKCPLCGDLVDVMERCIVEKGVVWICIECMDRVVEEIQSRLDKETDSGKS